MVKRVLERAIDAYLHFWARLVVRARRPLVVGVTGSVGKTGTTEAIAAALTGADARPIVGSVRRTAKNMNNTRGVPLVVLGYSHWPRSRRELLAWLLAAPVRALALATVQPYPRVLVLEFAAGPKGDIARTSSVAPPMVAVVTAIGPAHLEAFGTIGGIVEEKGALVRRVPACGLVVLGAENVHASGLDRVTRARVVKVAGRGVTLSGNAARAVAEFFGVPREATERALADRPAVPGRLHVVEAGRLTVIDDSYNANPLSMQLGLDTLGEHPPRRVAILGDMKELGAQSPQYHREIGAYARARADVVAGVGPLARDYEADLWFATSDACAEALTRFVAAGDTVLVKGSRSIEMEKVVRTLREVASREVA